MAVSNLFHAVARVCESVTLDPLRSLLTPLVSLVGGWTVRAAGAAAGVGAAVWVGAVLTGAASWRIGAPKMSQLCWLARPVRDAFVGAATGSVPKMLELPPPGGARTRDVGRPMSPIVFAAPPIPDMVIALNWQIIHVTESRLLFWATNIIVVSRGFISIREGNAITQVAHPATPIIKNNCQFEV